MPLKISFLMQIETDAPNTAVSFEHIGGWSESWYLAGNAVPGEWKTVVPQARANLLPRQGVIIGFRAQQYTIAGNKLMPGISTSGALRFPGAPAFPCDLPGVSLLCVAGTAGGTNNRRFAMRGIPDSVMITGEYAPDANWDLLKRNYFNQLVVNSAGFVGRDPSVQTVRIVSLINKVLTTNPALGAAQNDMIRLIRATDIDGNAIGGVYTAATVAGNTVTLLEADPSTIVENSGRARVDKLAFLLVNEIGAVRSVTRKIGRPFDQSRGRRSKRPTSGMSPAARRAAYASSG